MVRRLPRTGEEHADAEDVVKGETRKMDASNVGSGTVHSKDLGQLGTDATAAGSKPQERRGFEQQSKPHG